MAKTTDSPIFIKNFKNLKVWQKSMEIVKEIYLISATFPDFEKFALRTQINRSATSISLNLAEGNGQIFIKKEINHFSNALGSSSETLGALAIALQNKYITLQKHNELEEKINEIIKMMIGYMRKLQEDVRNED